MKRFMLRFTPLGQLFISVLFFGGYAVKTTVMWLVIHHQMYRLFALMMLLGIILVSLLRHRGKPFRLGL